MRIGYKRKRMYFHKHREKTQKLLNTRISEESVKIKPWLLLNDLFDMLTQAIKFYKFHLSHIKEDTCLKKATHQISKNGTFDSLQQVF